VKAPRPRMLAPDNPALLLNAPGGTA